MGGIASKRCDACRKLVMVSDRGDVETVGAARGVGNDRDGTDRAICACGMLVAWPRKGGSGASQTMVRESVLANAHPRNGPVCAQIGHDPLDPLPTPQRDGRLVRFHHVCRRCGAVYATETHA